MCLVKSDPVSDLAHNYDVLGLDYVDLMLLHWPCDDIEDSVKAYEAIVTHALHNGKARAIGISNFNASQLAEFLPRVSVKPAINQCGYSIAGHSDDRWGRDDATKAACEAHNITYSAYSPLGGWAKGSLAEARTRVFRHSSSSPPLYSPLLSQESSARVPMRKVGHLTSSTIPQ